jgi:hypothetical protein
MKIILSRKGFDSTSGGVPSPIFEDGTMLSLPIPRKSDISYGGLKNPFNDGKFPTLGELVEQLTSYRMSEHSRAHLDPDLNFPMIERSAGWRGIFGQNGIAQRTLKNVQQGDLFLFFGLFQKVLRNRENVRYEYDRNQPQMHVIHGWLKVGETYRIPEDMERIPAWAKYHPHVTFRDIEESPNVIYVAAEKLASDSQAPGWGVFREFGEELRLTHPERCYDKRGKLKHLPSRWRLPAWFYDPQRSPQPLTQFGNCRFWSDLSENFVTLETSKARTGQECVLDCKDYEHAAEWAKNKIESFHCP